MNDNHTKAESAMARAARLALARHKLREQHDRDPTAVPQHGSRDARLGKALKRQKRENQRLDHLVLGHERPTSRAATKRGRKRKGQPIQLEPGIEEAVAVRERWSHKQGTPETHEHASRTHQGALAQLHANGTIDNEQLEWAAEIANVHRSIESDVTIGNASLEARVDCSGRGGTVQESIRRVRLHVAYGYWREQLPMPKRLVLDMIVGDAVGYTVAAARYRVHNRKAKRLLLEAIDRWPACVTRAYRSVSEEHLEDLNSRLAAA
jgi:hypothetical protein